MYDASTIGQKKISQKLIPTLSASYVRDFVYCFESGFQAHTHNRTEVALHYFLGLLKMEKGQGNMERMEEEIPESEYRAYQHFLSVSNWKHQDIIDKVAMEASLFMEAEKARHGKATGLIIDESAHLKRRGSLYKCRDTRIKPGAQNKARACS